MSFLASIRALYLPRGFFLGWAPGRSWGLVLMGLLELWPEYRPSSSCYPSRPSPACLQDWNMLDLSEHS
jgi:hypothetical protein